MLEKFTNTFNNILSGSIGRKYEFEVFFQNSGDRLEVQLQISYKESDRESDKQSSWVDLNYESIGFRTLIALCSYLFNDQDKSKKVFVMDEPFTNIHPKAQRQVSRMLQSLSQRFQIIYATHSPHLLPERDKVRCTLTEAAGDLSICKFEKYPLNRFYDLSPLALDTLEEIKMSDSIINVLVDGKTDRHVYENLFKLKGISGITNVISVNGNSNMRVYADSLKHSKKTRNLFVLDPGEKIPNYNGLSKIIDKHDHLFKLPLEVIEGNHVKKGIENLMPNHIIEKAFKQNIGNIKIVETIETYGGTPVKEYTVDDVVGKSNLVEFFLNEAKENDYDFFKSVINKIEEIQSSLSEN